VNPERKQEGPRSWSLGYPRGSDKTPDGQRFLINVNLSEVTAAPITVVLNWQKAVTSGK
jgi:hypothetical protein